MFRIAVVALLMLTFAGCKKAIENAQIDLLVQRITDGRWKVTGFTKGGKAVTTDFAPYQFQFHKNNTVDAYKENVLEKTGSWQGDITTETITSQFTNAAYPLELLNGTWKITNSTWTSVDATLTVNNELSVLRLDKL